jgi:putative phosphonate catabolism associated alcohol dehydrogenase
VFFARIRFQNRRAIIFPTTPKMSSAEASLASCWLFTSSGTPQSLESVPLPPALAPGEILVALRAATVCGSDVHTIEGRRTDPAAPLVLGHEGMGVIVAMGARPGGEGEASQSPQPPSHPLSVGDRVTFSVAASCGRCDPCTSWSIPQKCTGVYKYGHAPFLPDRTAGKRAVEGLAGTYATHLLLRPGSAVVRIPDAIPDAVAAPANCALATVCAALRSARHVLSPARPAAVLVQGCGLLGLYACALAARGGARCVVATDVSPARRALALRFGATAAVDAAASDADAQVKAAAAAAGCPGGVDVVLEVCGVVSAVRQAIACVRVGGAVALVGLVHPASDLGGVLTGEMIIRKSAILIGVHNYAPEDLVEGVAFLEEAMMTTTREGGIPLAELTSAPMALSRLPEAVEEARKGTYPRVLVVPDAVLAAQQGGGS